ncbi:MAG: hypothetical protein JXB30_12000 [Anaerolineae bacterium]|nr:hypothetical protein [Anaerolineae bacterium]
MKSIDKTGVVESRREPNAFYFTKLVTVHKPVADVFDFLVEDMPARRAMFAKEYESFAIDEEGEIFEDSMSDPGEVADGQETLGHFELEKVPNELVYFSFCPSDDNLDPFMRKISVYCDLQEQGFSETLLTMTYVVQMANFWVKLFAAIIGAKKLLDTQLTEDLNAMKSDIERGDRVVSSRLADRRAEDAV